MLINVLLDKCLNIKISQSSVGTHLRCDGIFNVQFIMQSLLSPRVKKIWKSVNIYRSYGKLSTGLFFLMKYSVYALCTVKKLPTALYSTCMHSQ